MKSSNIGGQAVLEGIMMKNGESMLWQSGKPDGEIKQEKMMIAEQLPYPL